MNSVESVYWRQRNHKNHKNGVTDKSKSSTSIAASLFRSFKGLPLPERRLSRHIPARGIEWSPHRVHLESTCFHGWSPHGVLSGPRCNLYWIAPFPSLEQVTERRSSSFSRSWRTRAQRTPDIFCCIRGHLLQLVQRTLPMAHTNVVWHAVRLVPWSKISSG